METDTKVTHWFTSFKKGVVACFAICSVIASIAVYFNSQILDLKNETIDRLEKGLASKEDFADKYHKEQVLRKQFELKAAQLQEILDAQFAFKWEEKYESEKLRRQAVEENLNLLEVRAAELKKSLESREQPDPTKDAEIKFLKEQLQIAKAENDQLRVLYTKVKEQKSSPQNSAVPVPATSNAVYKMVIAAIPDLTSTDTSKVIINAYKDSKHTITISQLAGLAPAMTSSDIVRTIKAIAHNIRNDGSIDSVKRITNECTSTDAQTVMAILVKAEKTH